MIGLQDLEGRWTLARVIEDARAGLTGHVDGRAVWRPDGVGLRQEETGLLRYGAGAPMRAERSYLWRAEAGALVVYFDDGRPFHRVAKDALSDRHWCDPDIYDVTYDFAQWPRWQTVWHVRGPRKDMVITSRFSPEMGAIPPGA
ncbi:hypothetical protein roselon_03293 [Roseibacterium elongatum DSM 19469]|uniref:DUF6314 domain-containing protein n=1 Tax=Roseicyclus elongatus DSM 19469 TaxID=1294273 RepID=W8S996_9RHOB|nr:DUF6314 family protein [Roseibacterium elongatum]AHM05551.1 hypothetical protein roselon_03293 [Roseibacterium elongatum DSM 19469]